jgi:hypothetical protein
MMDCYTAIFPKNEIVQESSYLYVLNSCINEENNTLGYFDLLETALHALDLVYKYKSDNYKKDDFIYVSRIIKNTLKFKSVVLVSWNCLGPSVNGISNGEITFNEGLRTNNIET